MMKQAGKLILCLSLALAGLPLLQQKPASAASDVAPQIASGYYHSISLGSNGTVWSWGNNDFGQLGIRSTRNSNIPVQAAELTDVIAVAGGVRNSVALKQDGTVWAWGRNVDAELGDGTTDSRTVAIQVPGLENVTDIAGAVGNHSLALKADGTVWAWGRNVNGELGDGTTMKRTLPVQVDGLNGVTKIASGGYFSLALKSNGTVWAWGINENGELGDGTSVQHTTPVQVAGLTDVIAIAAGGSHSIALKSDGTVWTWGQGIYGQIGDGGTSKRTTPVQVDGLADIIAIVGGGYHSLALTSDGKVWSWGSNGEGQLGDGTMTTQLTPVAVTSLSGVTGIAAGGFHSIALTNDGAVWGWGYNGYGQLGDGSTATRLSPVRGDAELDLSPPAVDDATITASSVTNSEATLSWNKATDNVSAPSDLQYLVYRSESGNIGSVDDIEANGTPIGVYTADIDTLRVTELAEQTTVYFNVIVKDKRENKRAYAMQQVTTLAVPRFSVTYDGNGHTAGGVPADANRYEEGDEVTVTGNTYGLEKDQLLFAGWSPQASEPETVYTAGDTFAIGAADVVLYAVWTEAPDTEEPVAVSYLPHHLAAGVETESDLMLTFSEPVKAVPGKSIVIKRLPDNSMIETIAATDTDKVSLAGPTVTIRPQTVFAYSTVYYVEIENGAFADAAGNGYAGIDSAAVWSFETKSDPGSLVPNGPANLIATAGDESVRLNWNAVTGAGTVTYAVYQVVGTAAPANPNDWALIQANVTSATYTVTGLTNGTSYAFAVTASNTGGTSSYSNVASATPRAAGGNGGSRDGGGYYAGGDSGHVISTNGTITIPVGKSGEVNLDGEIAIKIPVGAAEQALRITIEKQLEPSRHLTDQETMVSHVFEVLKNFSGNFKKPVTLSLRFDPNKVGKNQKVAIFYYDEDKKTWIEVGGTVDGQWITAEIDHFTKFAVLVVDKKPVITFSDITEHWAEEQIKQAASQGIVNGYVDGSFKPNATVTRTEFIVMLMNALKPAGDDAQLSFTDHATIGAWAQKAVAQSIAAGIVTGYSDGSFRPNANISRIELAVMIARAYGIDSTTVDFTGFVDDDDIPVWAKPAVLAVRESGIVKGIGNNRFAPNTTATRAEAIAMIINLLKAK